MSKGYDDSDPRSILDFARKLIDRTLRPFVEGQTDSPAYRRHKGRFGNLVEKFYFGVEPNSRAVADFPRAGVELKSSPIKLLKSKKEFRAKERLVLGMIDYDSIVGERFDLSSFIKKNACILLIFYQWQKDLSLLDYPIRIVDLWSLLDLPDEDQKIIRDDWERIRKKVDDGLAHELSEGDTLYLGACTKGIDSSKVRSQPNSRTKAKGRAFSLKQGYVNVLLQRDYGVAKLDVEPIVASVTEYAEGETFEDKVIAKLRPFMGLTDVEIAKRVRFDKSASPKHFHAILTNRMLGVKTAKVEEFEKAGIVTKTVRLNRRDTPEEDISFPYFKYKELVKQDWETSDFREALERRYLFVVYRRQEDGSQRFETAFFWTMPAEDKEGDAYKVWKETVRRIRDGKAGSLPKKSDNPVAHVRPHASNKADTDETPDGRRLTKKSFWLNAGYIKRQIEHHGR